MKEGPLPEWDFLDTQHYTIELIIATYIYQISQRLFNIYINITQIDYHQTSNIIFLIITFLCQYTRKYSSIYPFLL